MPNNLSSKRWNRFNHASSYSRQRLDVGVNQGFVFSIFTDQGSRSGMDCARIFVAVDLLFDPPFFIVFHSLCCLWVGEVLRPLWANN
jgi:hypothetical protein